MATLYKVTSWQGASGNWYCNDVSDLGGIRGEWWVPARLLGKKLEDYVSMLVNEFKVTSINYNAGVLTFSWDNSAACRKYANWINKKAREGKWFL